VRTIGVILGLLALGALIVLAVAGVAGATAVLVTAAAVLGMIFLGNLVAGRNTPNRAPFESPGEPAAETAPPPDERRGTPGS
jgi:hypothetical protein